ncbi:MAG: aldo/keto reductase [Candidatus Obscuribacter sp.]|nr:aldo/keto reductase [Candidatus Obscuribacter sp.]
MAKAAEANTEKSKVVPAKGTPGTEKQIKSLATYYLLGKSGLRVSPLSLGTATFGEVWEGHWSSDKDTAKAIVKRYLEAGGNFLDTADGYHEGQSEEITGELVHELTNRDEVVLATKYTFGTRAGDPNGGGNGRKHMLESVEKSLKRLKTDYIDLYWVHNWDTMTPAEEVMSSLNSLVQSGKVRYIGLSNPPAWYLGRAQTLAEWRGWEKIAAIQMEYSLAVRNIEFEYTDAAIELGIGICPWSPLANGLLTGKYKRENGQIKGDGRLASTWITDPHMDASGDKAMAMVDVLVEVAGQLGRTPAQVALNWVTNQPGVVSTIIGASKLTQLEDNINALEFEIPTALLEQLNQASEPKLQYPYFFHTGDLHKNVSAQTRTLKTPKGYFKR